MKRLVIFTGLAALVACNGKQGEVSGIDSYRFGRTTRGSIHDGICQPTDLNDGRKATWCFALPPFKIGKRNGDVDAYFLGTGNDAPLIELQIKIRGCVEEEASQWMRERFGPPIESKGNREYWKNSFLWAGAFLPDQPGRCIIHFLPLSENAEIDRLKQTGSAAGSGSAGSGS
jgi:hypothetical protein